MSEPEFSVILHRIEVHASGDAEEAPSQLWKLSVRPAVDGTVRLAGYLRRAEPIGFGQAQVAAFAGAAKWSEVSRNKSSRASFQEWVEKYAAEAMFDTARRALQIQAAMMDFTFDIDSKAPEASLEFARKTGNTQVAKPATQ